MDRSDAKQVTVEDLVYHISNGQPLLARLYLPAHHPPVAGVVSVHGGRWCSETRLTNTVIDQALAESGLAVMAIDFRMPPLVRYPDPIADINVAIRWLKHRADLYGMPISSIGGIGTSSGGHQLLLNALKPLDSRYAALAPTHPAGLLAKDYDASLRFIIACWPVTDPVARYHYAIEQKMSLHVESHLAYWADEEQMFEGSPQRIVTEGEASHLPPLLLIQGTGDIILPPDMADKFAVAYKVAGGAVELMKLVNQPHTFITKFPESMAAQEALHAIRRFIAKQL